MRVSWYKKIIFSFVYSLVCLPLFAEEKITKPLGFTEKNSVNQITPAESLLPMLLGLCAILIVIFLLAMMLKKMTGLNVISNNIKVIESQSLGAKEKLVIVEIQHKQYVLGVTAHSINQICELEDKIEKKPAMVSFDKIMKQLLSNNKSAESNKKSENQQ